MCVSMHCVSVHVYEHAFVCLLAWICVVCVYEFVCVLVSKLVHEHECVYVCVFMYTCV